MVILDCRVYLASEKMIWVVLGGLGGCWVFMLTSRVYSASLGIWVVLGDLGGRWVIIHDNRVYLANLGGFKGSRGLLGGNA